MFITNASTSLAGPPRETKHHGKVARPMVAYEYLESSPGIDIHNHYRTGSCGLEDVWKTTSATHRQVSGVLGFLFTNAFLTKKFFQKTNLKHHEFKIMLANKMVKFEESKRRMRSLPISLPASENRSEAVAHLPKLIKEGARHQQVCWYCQHDPAKPPANPKVKTSYCCDLCGPSKSLCHPDTGRFCFRAHIELGMPPKRKWVANKPQEKRRNVAV